MTEQTTTYRVIDTMSGAAVVREDGTMAEFLGFGSMSSRQEAEEAAALLASGDTSEDDYEWTAK